MEAMWPRWCRRELPMRWASQEVRLLGFARREIHAICSMRQVSVKDMELGIAIYIPEDLGDVRKLIRGGSVAQLIGRLENLERRGNASAAAVLALILLNGYMDVPPSPAAALDILRRHPRGDGYCEWVRAWALFEQRRFVEAVDGMEYAANLLFLPAITDFGTFLGTGIGCSQPCLPDAEGMLLLSIRHGHAPALARLAEIWRRGAFAWWKKAMAWPVAGIGIGWLLVERFRDLFSQRGLLRVRESRALWEMDAGP